MWEFLAGACAGLFRKKFNSIKNYNSGLYISISLFGLILILISLYGSWDYKEKEFLQIVIVVLSTTLVIAFSNSYSGFGKILAYKPLVAIGLISFSAYLWHQPIFVFYRYFNISPISLEIYFFLIFLVFILSFFSWKYIELPYRDISLVGRKKFISSSLIFGGIILGFAIFIKYYNGLPNRFSLDSSVNSYFNEKNECTSNEKYFEPCIVGNLNRPEIDILVVGDSHSKSIMPAFNLIGNQENLKVARIGAPGCPPLLGIYVLRGNGHEKTFCPEVADKQLEFVINNNIKKVIFVARWSKYFDVDQSGNRSFYLGFSSGDMIDNQISKLKFIEKFKSTINKYQQSGIKVLVLTQIPEQDIDSKEIYYLLSRQKSDKDREKILKNYSVKYINHINSNKAFSDFLNSMEIKTINLDSFFCNLELCKFGVVSQPYFRDRHHLSVIGARSLSPLLRDKLSAYGFLY
jgi:hypothetical protein